MPDPMEPLASASVILWRPDPAGEALFEIFLLKRRGKSRFMPNCFVFPGGRVEPHDGDDPFSEKTLLCCAIRELWEEAGVILAKDPVAVTSLSDTELGEVRSGLQKGGASLDDALNRLGLAPGVGFLTPYARWITPVARKQRYDTFFYTAQMPQGQKAVSDHLETTEGIWISPLEALRQNESGEVSLAPPQVRILGELSVFKELTELDIPAVESKLEPVLPFLWTDGSTRVILLPWDPDYEKARPGDLDRLGLGCPADQATRLLHSKGRWQPLRMVA
ncbi:NUDIX hydrolase [Dethiosulfatarculus sandiegensis]|nr:NUDIX hydrolase [Dethiosulfatarculus sandiegensis]